MMEWVSGAIESTKAAYGITKAMVTIRDESLIQARVFELNTVLADLQQQMLQGQREQMSLLDELARTKKELSELSEARMKDDKYERRQFPSGNFAYQLRGENAQGEANHFLCSLCFEKGTHVTLHAYDRGDLLTCPACKYGVRVAALKPHVPRPR
ncbi:hypothetical protein [Pseudomonas sp. F(2018)]|uniref:hypothetical protein n=1 Tax=Pseudomonas sp. F(2018) TaxID=2502240 RepID=UPI0010F9E111|nr:hypothetical protein [Pseudomonas sp. F(2018)]